MENGIIFAVEGMQGPPCEKRIKEALGRTPGIESVTADSRQKRVEILGADLDRMQLLDTVEGLGFTVLE